MHEIEVSGVRKTFVDASSLRTIEVIRNLTFEIQEGEFVSIVGPSGCGKTTMFNIIAGLLEPSAGTVRVKGVEVTGPTPDIGYMMQRDLLMPWRTVQENIELGLEVKGTAKSERRARAEYFLDRFNMGEFAQSYPDEISGGMRQRVALMRTLALGPEIVLLDEPFSALDYQTRLILEDEIVTTLRELGKTGVLITHDIGEAIAMSDRIVVVANRPTYVKEVLDVGIFAQTGSSTVARSHPEYVRLFGEIWDLLDTQMARSGSNGSGN